MALFTSSISHVSINVQFDQKTALRVQHNQAALPIREYEPLRIHSEGPKIAPQVVTAQTTNLGHSAAIKIFLCAEVRHFCYEICQTHTHSDLAITNSRRRKEIA